MKFHLNSLQSNPAAIGMIILYNKIENLNNLPDMLVNSNAKYLK